MVSPRPGAGDDYYGLREFRRGDSLRQVAWKRTAFLDQLVCIERTGPAPESRIRVKTLETFERKGSNPMTQYLYRVMP